MSRYRYKSCGSLSEDCYRCDECGHDMTGDTSTEGRHNV